MAIAEIFQINHSQSDHRRHMGICIILSSKSDCLASTSILSCSKAVPYSIHNEMFHTVYKESMVL